MSSREPAKARATRQVAGDLECTDPQLKRTQVVDTNPCNGRRTVAEARRDFPEVDFSCIETDEDEYGSRTQREDFGDMGLRGYRFLAWLRSRPEREVAVGTHSCFLYALLNIALLTDDEPGSGLGSWLATGEMRSVWIWFEDV